MDQEIENGKWLSLDEAATALGTTRLNVMMHIKRNLLEGREESGGWVVSADSIESLASRGSETREVLCATGCPKAGSGCSCG